LKNDYLNGILICHKKNFYLRKLSKKGPNSEIWYIWKMYTLSIFHLILTCLMCFFPAFVTKIPAHFFH